MACPTSNYWLSMADIYVDPAGDNRNKGDASNRAIATCAELRRRNGLRRWSRQVNVHFSNSGTSIPATDELTIDGTFSETGLLRLFGAPDATRQVIWDSQAHGSAGFTSVTATDETVTPNGQFGRVADTSLSNTWVNLGIVQTWYRIRLTTGTNTGAYAWLMVDSNSIQAKSVQVSPWIMPSTTVPVPVTMSIVTPSVGDQYVVEVPSGLPNCTLNAVAMGDPVVQTNQVYLAAYDLAFSDSITGAFVVAGGGLGVVMVVGCNMDRYICTAGCPTVLTWGSRGSSSLVQGFVSHNAALLRSQQLVSNGGNMQLANNSIGYTSTFICRFNGSIQVIKAGFGGNTDAIAVHPDGTLRIGGNLMTTGTIWGGTTALPNTGYGVRVMAGGKASVAAGSTTKLTGALGDLRVGQIGASWTDVPVTEDDAGAWVVIQ